MKFYVQHGKGNPLTEYSNFAEANENAFRPEDLIVLGRTGDTPSQTLADLKGQPERNKLINPSKEGK